MISQSAKDGFDHLLKSAMGGVLRGDGDAPYNISAVDDPHLPGGSRMVVITISSYLFRLMVFIHFTSDSGTRSHMAKINKTPAAQMNDQAFLDAVRESANMGCGAMSRELAKVFAHTGMSTPNILDRECAAYLHMLRCSHIRHFKLEIDQAALFHISLCVSEYADLDFHVDENTPEEVTGELEMF